MLILIFRLISNNFFNHCKKKYVKNFFHEHEQNKTFSTIHKRDKIFMKFHNNYHVMNEILCELLQD